MTVRVLRDEAGLRVVELSQEFLTWGAPAGLRQKVVELGEHFVSLKTLANNVSTAHVLLTRSEMISLVFLYESYKRGDGPGYGTDDGSGAFYDSSAYQTRYVRLSEIFMPQCDPPKLSGTIAAFDPANAVFWQLDDERLDRIGFTRGEMDGLVEAWRFYDVVDE